MRVWYANLGSQVFDHVPDQLFGHSLAPRFTGAYLNLARLYQVLLEHDAVRIGEKRAAQGGKGSDEKGFDTGLGELRGRSAPQPEPAASCAIKCLRGTCDELDRVAITRVRGVAPRDEPMLLEQDGAGRRVGIAEIGFPTLKGCLLCFLASRTRS